MGPEPNLSSPTPNGALEPLLSPQRPPTGSWCSVDDVAFRLDGISSATRIPPGKALHRHQRGELW